MPIKTSMGKYLKKIKQQSFIFLIVFVYICPNLAADDCPFLEMNPVEQEAVLKKASSELGAQIKVAKKLETSFIEGKWSKQDLDQLAKLQKGFSVCMKTVGRAKDCSAAFKADLQESVAKGFFKALSEDDLKSFLLSIAFYASFGFLTTVDTFGFHPVIIGSYLVMGLVSSSIFVNTSYNYFKNICSGKKNLLKLFGTKENKKLFFDNLGIAIPENRQGVFMMALLEHNFIMPAELLGDKNQVKLYIEKYISELESVVSIYSANHAVSANIAPIQAHIKNLKKANKFFTDAGAIRAIAALAKVNAQVNNQAEVIIEQYPQIAKEVSMIPRAERLSEEGYSPADQKVKKLLQSNNPRINKLLEHNDSLLLNTLSKGLHQVEGAELSLEFSKVSENSVSGLSSVYINLKVSLPGTDEKSFPFFFQVSSDDWDSLKNPNSLFRVQEAFNGAIDSQAKEIFYGLGLEDFFNNSQMLGLATALQSVCDPGHTTRGARRTALDAQLDAAVSERPSKPTAHDSPRLRE